STSLTPSMPSIEEMSLFCYEVENMLGQVNRAGSDYYALLGLGPQSLFEEIASTYEKLQTKFSLESHKEIIAQIPTLGNQLETICNRIGEAYKMLSNPQDRLKYTTELKRSTGR